MIIGLVSIWVSFLGGILLATSTLLFKSVGCFCNELEIAKLASPHFLYYYSSISPWMFAWPSQPVHLTQGDRARF